jgi:phosphate transport system permease protein
VSEDLEILGPTSGRTRFAAGAAHEATVNALGRQPGGAVLRNRLFLGLILVMVSSALFGLALILFQSLRSGWPALSPDLLTKPTSQNAERAGFKVAILGTLWLIGLMVLMVVPVGVAAAVHLEEFADRTRWWNKLIELNIQNLAAVPAIVYGILGLAFIVRGPIDLGFILFAGSITMALLVLPVIIIATREALRAVPPSIREGSLALGATQWQTTWRQVLPAAVPGILTGIILAVSRAMGEAAPLLLLGATTFVTFNPQPFSDTGYTVLPVLIYNYARRPQQDIREVAAAGIIILLAMVLLMNSFAIWLRNRYEQQW